MIYALRVVAIATVITFAVEVGVAYWWLSYDPFPEGALSLID